MTTHSERASSILPPLKCDRTKPLSFGSTAKPRNNCASAVASNIYRTFFSCQTTRLHPTMKAAQRFRLPVQVVLKQQQVLRSRRREARAKAADSYDCLCRCNCWAKQLRKRSILCLCVKKMTVHYNTWDWVCWCSMLQYARQSQLKLQLSCSSLQALQGDEVFSKVIDYLVWPVLLRLVSHCFKNKNWSRDATGNALKLHLTSTWWLLTSLYSLFHHIPCHSKVPVH